MCALLGYLCFSRLYWEAGGTGLDGSRAIYPIILDYDRPLVVAGALLATLLVLCPAIATGLWLWWRLFERIAAGSSGSRPEGDRSLALAQLGSGADLQNTSAMA